MMIALSRTDGERRGMAPLENMPLAALAERIAVDGDRQALEELLVRRPVFHHGQRRSLLLGDYIYALWDTNHRDSATVSDDAYDITMEKFSRLPGAPHSEDGLKRRGPDCRYYYKAFLRGLGTRTREASYSQVEEEYRVGRLLQRFVTRHFYLSLLDARRRSNPSISRYAWSINGRGTITVWLPKTMSGKARRKWLEANVPDPNPSRPGEQERVQAIVDSRVVRGRLVPLEQVEGTMACSAPDDHPSQAALSAERVSFRLSEFVAKEKALGIDLQRPSIRVLGPERLEQLVLALFDNLLEQEKTFEVLAQTFNLTKSTLSRFAGSRWAKGRDGHAGFIPDLWLNVSRVLARHPRFVEVAKRAGVFERAFAMAQGSGALCMREANNG